MTQHTLSTPKQHLLNDIHWFANIYQAQLMGMQNMNSVVGCSCHTSLQTITIILRKGHTMSRRSQVLDNHIVADPHLTKELYRLKHLESPLFRQRGAVELEDVSAPHLVAFERETTARQHISHGQSERLHNYGLHQCVQEG